MISLKIPASTANLGPGFDSIGMAVNRYLEIEAEVSDTWKFTHHSEELKGLPSDASHYIAQMVEHFCKVLEVETFAMDVHMKSDIPLARGLGSSATALIASLLLVDVYHRLNLSEETKIHLLSEVEGHPDNIVPSLIGGLIAGYSAQSHCYYQVLPAIEWPLFALIPHYELETKTAREVLPDTFAYGEAVAAGAIGNVLVAALANKNYPLAGIMMTEDKYHEPYRQSLIKEFGSVREAVGERGYVVISGAGSTMLLMIKPEFKEEIQNMTFESLDCIALEVDEIGAVVKVN